MKRIKTGFIGVGGRGRGTAGNVYKLKEQFEITAAADTSRESTDEFKNMEYGKDVPVYENYKEMLEKEEIEAVIISLPNYLHAPAAVYFLDKGIPVLLEKPMAVTIADCREIIRKAEENNVVLHIGMELNYNLLMNEMYQKLNDGVIGELRMLWFEEFRLPFMKKTGDWIIQKKYSGGTFVEKNCHHFDLFNWFAGSPPVRVFAAASHDIAHKKDNGFWKTLKSENAVQDVIDNGFVTVEYENGIKASLILCMFSPYKGHSFNLIGGKGSLEAKMSELTYIHRNIENPSYTVNKIRVPDEKNLRGHGGGSEYGQLMDFYREITEGRKVKVTGQKGLMALAVGLAAEKSAEEKRAVEMTEILGQ
jgi:myo-inositol 2-dehydrogenase / D-chiro-inositol 1-dehydrogenase